MSSVGVNVARDGHIPVSIIRGLGVTWVRIVAMPTINLTPYFQELRANGINILLVLARESGNDYARYAQLYGGLVAAIQCGNEPDLVSPSSWTMSQQEVGDLGKLARRFFPRPMPLVCAGLASGHPEWLQGVDLSPFDALAFHPYLKDAANPGDLEDLQDVDTLIPDYAAYGLPLLVTEWGWWDDAEPRASEEVRDMTRWAAQTGDLEVFFYFCAADSMVPPFGLLRADGADKPRARAFRDAAAQAIHSLWPQVQAPKPTPQPNRPDPWQFWTADQIAAACRIPSQFRANIAVSWPKLVEQLALCGINDRPTQVAMAATVAIETARRFKAIHEFRNADGSIPDYWHGYDGGPEFHGRGFIQNTHRYNYRALGPKIAALWGAGPDDPTFDLVANPDNLLDPDMSAAAAAIYFRERGISAMAQRRDWAAVRRAVQGQAAPPDSIESVRRDAEALWALGAPSQSPPPVDTRDEQIAALTLALKTLRDDTLPSVRARLDEAERIVRQFVGEPA